MGDAQPATIDTLSARVRELMGAGQPAAAAPLLQELIRRFDAERPADTFMRAEVRRVLGLALLQTKDLPGSTATFEEAIRVSKESAQPDGWNRVGAATLGFVARNYNSAGLADKASAARRESMDLADRGLTVDPDRASLTFLSAADDERVEKRDNWDAPITALIARSAALEPPTALRVLWAVHTFWAERGGVDEDAAVIAEMQRRIRTLDNATVAANFGLLHNIAHAAMRPNLDAAREITGRLAAVANADKPEEVFAVRRLEAVAAIHSHADDAVERARAAYDYALKSFGETDKGARVSLKDLAHALESADQPDEAIKVFETALDLEQRIGKEPLTIADIAYSLGRLLDREARFAEACRSHEIALEQRSRELGPRHQLTNRSRYEVAELSRILYRVEEAELFYRQALEVETDVRGPQTGFAAQILNNLGELYTRLGRFAAARKSIHEALVIRTKLDGENSELAWRSRQSLAMLASFSGDPAQTVTLARAALTQAEISDAAWTLALGRGLLQQGEYAEAEQHYRRLFEAAPRDQIGRAVIRDQYLELLEGLVACRVGLKHWSEALEPMPAMTTFVRELLPVVVANSSEMQLVRFARSLLDLQSLWLWTLSRAGAPPAGHLAAAFELVQIVKGLRTRYLRWRQPGAANVDTLLAPDVEAALKTRLAAMRELQDELTKAELSRDASARDEVEPLEILAKRGRLRQIERDLAGDISPAETLLEGELPKSYELLAEGIVAIEFVVVRDVMAKWRSGATAAHRYMAFTVQPGTPASIRLVDLGLCDDLDNAITDMRESLANELWTDEARPPRWHRLSRFLGAKIVTPLWNEIQGARHLLISPDGLLAALPIEILGTPDSEYLLDKVQGRISYLMRFAELARSRELFNKGGPSLVIAGPDFNLPNSYVGKFSGMWESRLLARAAGGSTRFDDLPAAREEGAAVAKLLQVPPLLGAWALAQELRLNGSPEVIHLSTHGFSLPFEHAEVTASLASPLGNALDRRVVLDDPMQRSGLTTSGANAALDGRAIPPEAGSGTIYAADIQQLDLQRTDLVVLSACRSGLGDIAVGDGSHGLRRAFLAAGARTVISALWDVPDNSSKLLITRFYEQLLLKQQTRLEALAEARKDVRALHRHDPVHWAGFVLDGDFGQLARFTGLSELTVASLSFKSWMEDSESVPAPEVPPSAFALKQQLKRRDLSEREQVDVLRRLGDLANRLGDNDESVACYRVLLTVPSLSAENRTLVSYNLAKILLQMRRVEESISAYSDVLKLAPDADVKARVLVNRGIANYLLHRTPDAVADLTAVIDSADAPPDQKMVAHINRAEVLSESDQEAALADVNAALASDQANDLQRLNWRLFRAQLLTDIGRSSEALPEITDLERDAARYSDDVRAVLARLRERTSPRQNDDVVASRTTPR